VNAMERKENIKMELRETGCGDQLWMNMAQDCSSWQALVCVSLCLQFPLSQCSFDILVRTSSIKLNESQYTCCKYCHIIVNFAVELQLESIKVLCNSSDQISLFLTSRRESTASDTFLMENLNYLQNLILIQWRAFQVAM
jgi:hypothetical protein